jgi:hypothetical protein
MPNVNMSIWPWRADFTLSLTFNSPISVDQPRSLGHAAHKTAAVPRVRRSASKKRRMGFFEDVGNAFTALADAVTGGVEAGADVVEAVGNTTGEVVEDVIETVANGVADFTTAVGDSMANIPIMGGVVGGAIAWVGGVVSEVLGLVGGIISGVFAVVFGIVGGLIRIIGGTLLLNAKLIKEGCADIGTAIAGAGMLIGGKILSTGQVLVFAQDRKRRLTKEEMAILNRVFRRSLALYNIRVVDGASGLFGVNAAKFTLGNVIYMKGANSTADPGIFVHESTHAWQYQHSGARYSMDAVWALNYVPAPYEWLAEIDRGHEQWVDFNLEAQANFIAEVYDFGEIVDGAGVTVESGDGVFYEAGDPSVVPVQVGFTPPVRIGKFTAAGGEDHTDRANTAIAFIRSQTNFRPSQFLFS